MKTEKAKWLALLPALFLLAVLPQESKASWVTDLLGDYLVARAQQAPSPILIIPGLTASQLQVKDSLCLTFRYHNLWFDYVRLFGDLECSLRELKLKYDKASDTYHNNLGVSIRAVDFGGTNGVEYLSNTLGFKSIPYFHKFVDYFVDEHNYQRDKSIRAAPYDWRLAADELERRGYFDNVKSLVETMYQDNGQQKVTIVGHSMGGPVSHYFLAVFSKVTQEWKDKYIHAYVPLAGAWSGGNAALPALISGIEGIVKRIPSIFAKPLAPVIRSFESLYWMMPRKSVWGSTPLVSTPSTHYTASDYQQLFGDLGYEDSYDMYSGVLSSSPDFPAPNVPTHCFYGVGNRTARQFKYMEDFEGKAPIGKKPLVSYGDGDSVVNIESSEMCLAWKTMPSQYPFEHKTFKWADHVDIVMNNQIFVEIARIVGASSNTF